MPCLVSKPFVSNGRFEILPTSEQWFDIAHYLTLTPTNPAILLRNKPLRHYITLAGPSVSCTAQVYDNTAHNIALALTRLTGKREPHLLGLCDWLYAQQDATINGPYLPEFRQYAQQLQTHPAWMGYKGYLVEELLHYADAHPKRAERIRAMVLMLTTGRPLGHRCRSNRVEGQIKVEIAKMGKIPRLFVNIGVEASLVGAWLAKVLKETMASIPWRTPTQELLFIPTAGYADLKRAFTKLHRAEAPFTMVLFSDDASAAFRDGHNVEYADLDISSCDKSHGDSLFKLLYDIVPVVLHQELTFVLDQMRQKLRIRNPDNRREYAELLPLFLMLYSGSVFTTIINNLANLLIGWAIARRQASTADQVKAAAASVGYIVTYKRAPTIHQVQFLKHSPCFDRSGELQPVLNIGVFLRAVGLCKNDLPGRGCLRERARAHAAAIAQCSWPNTSFPLINAFRTRFGAPSEATIKQYYQDHPQRNPKWPVLTFTDSAVLERYRYNQDGTTYSNAWFQVHNFFHNATVETITAGPDIAHVLTMDYDMDVLSYDRADHSYYQL